MKKRNYCIDCGKELVRRNAKRCKSCAHKGERGNLFGKTGSAHPNFINGWRKEKDEFRLLILQRENFICQNCGSSKDLHCHHGNNQKDFPEEMFVKENCFCLCNSCHTIYHNRLKRKYYLGTKRDTLNFLRGNV